MIEESGCQPDEKFYSALVRGCLQAGALEKAVSVVRCAHHLPGSGLTTSRGTPVGLETRVFDEVIAKLKACPCSCGSLNPGWRLLCAVGFQGQRYALPGGSQLEHHTQRDHHHITTFE